MKIKELAVNGLFSDGDWVESKDQDPEGDIRLIQLADIGDGYFVNKSNRFMNKKTAEKLKCTFLNKDDVLIARMPDPIGRACLFPFNESGKYVTVVDVGILRITDKYDSSYVMYGINSPLIRRQIEGQVTGTTRLRITKKKLGELEIPLPPLDQQKKIAAILDAADTYRQKTKALITKYDELTQSLFLDMFGDPVSNPKGWEKESLYLCLQKVEKIGKDYPGKNIEYVDIGSVDNIRNIITETTTYKIQERPSRAQQILLSGDIIISTVRPNLKNIALNQVDGRIGSTGFFVCRAVLNKLSNLFLFKVMLTDSVTDYFVGITSGASYPAVKSNDLKKFQVIVPPIDLQNQFAERVQAIEAQKAQTQASLSQAEDLFNSLLQKAFKGELS
jgi:type I restriction enzyme S subunit